jgi:Spy/CpxP family protein refolding chaperone
MKKTIMFAAFAAMASVGTLKAQNPDRPEGGRRGQGGPGRGGMMMGGALLRGITLTDAQKTQLAKIEADERAQMQAQRGQQQGRPDFEAIREAREKGDTATMNRLMREQRAKMDARRDAQVAAIRGILTADQQKQLDANVAEMKQREAQGGARGGMGARGGRGRGMRPPLV